MEVFEVYKMGVKEVCKKGYIVENDMYKKVWLYDKVYSV
jgi:hypothetical protein